MPTSRTQLKQQLQREQLQELERREAEKQQQQQQSPSVATPPQATTTSVKVPVHVDVVDVPPQILQVCLTQIFSITRHLTFFSYKRAGQNKTGEPNTLPRDTKAKEPS